MKDPSLTSSLRDVFELYIAVENMMSVEVSTATAVLGTVPVRNAPSSAQNYRQYNSSGAAAGGGAASVGLAAARSQGGLSTLGFFGAVLHQFAVDSGGISSSGLVAMGNDVTATVSAALLVAALSIATKFSLTNPAGAFFESMGVLQVLSNESEQALVGKINDRVHELSFRISDFTAHFTAQPLAMSNASYLSGASAIMQRGAVASALSAVSAHATYNNPASSTITTTNSSNTIAVVSSSLSSSSSHLGTSTQLLSRQSAIEYAVIEVEQLLLRYLLKLSAVLHRPTWVVGAVVQQGLSAIVNSFVEALRRELFLIGDAKQNMTLFGIGDSSV